MTDIIIEFVVKDVFKSAEFYTKYLGFKIEYTEYEPVSWVQLRNGSSILMLVTYNYTKDDIPNFKDYSPSTNLYKFRYDSLDRVNEIYELLKKDGKEFFLPIRKVDYGHEFGIYDEDKNMILVSTEE